MKWNFTGLFGEKKEKANGICNKYHCTELHILATVNTWQLAIYSSARLCLSTLPFLKLSLYFPLTWNLSAADLSFWHISFQRKVQLFWYFYFNFSFYCNCKSLVYTRRCWKVLLSQFLTKYQRIFLSRTFHCLLYSSQFYLRYEIQKLI